MPLSAVCTHAYLCGKTIGEPPLGLHTEGYLKNWLYSYCNIVPFVLHPLFCSWSRPYLTSPMWYRSGLLASLIFYCHCQTGWSGSIWGWSKWITWKLPLGVDTEDGGKSKASIQQELVSIIAEWGTLRLDEMVMKWTFNTRCMIKWMFDISHQFDPNGTLQFDLAIHCFCVRFNLVVQQSSYPIHMSGLHSKLTQHSQLPSISMTCMVTSTIWLNMAPQNLNTNWGHCKETSECHV
jgi:hypothetical protein